MTDVVVTMKLMGESPEADMNAIEKETVIRIKNFTGFDNYKAEVQEVAFGLKALQIMFVMDEAKGNLDPLEEDLSTIPEVNSVETTDVRRAVG